MSAAVLPSPCTDVCTIDPETGWCVGCLRTTEEIAAWGSADDASRRVVWQALPGRRMALERRGTAAGTSAGGGPLR